MLNSDLSHSSCFKDDAELSCIVPEYQAIALDHVLTTAGATCNQPFSSERVLTLVSNPSRAQAGNGLVHRM
jgi:hypothetical protein